MCKRCTKLFATFALFCGYYRRCLSPKGGSVEVYTIRLREAEFEVVSLRFELSTAPRIGLSPYPAIHSKTCGLAVNS
jgi:hypothetical protein